MALLLLSAVTASAAQRVHTAVEISSATVNSPFDLVGEKLKYRSEYARVPWFPEKLVYEVKYGILSMGQATLEAEEIVNFAGQPAFHVVSRARSNRFADKFYKVRDVNESWIHVGDLRSLGYSKKLREGKFFRDEWVLFDYDKKRFLAKRINRDQSFKYEGGGIPGMVQDMLSAIYFVRPRKLEVGDEVVLDVNTKKNWPLAIKVLRKQRLRLNGKWYNTILVEPFLRGEGLFIQKGKKLQLWLTNDKRHIPVLMRVEVIFGHISAYLIEIHR